MNTNLLHNLLNVAIALTGGVTAFLLATGCTTDAATGVLECSQSWIAPDIAASVTAGLGVVKIVINVIRDGISGLAKSQPPVQ